MPHLQICPIFKYRATVLFTIVFASWSTAGISILPCARPPHFLLHMVRAFTCFAYVWSATVYARNALGVVLCTLPFNNSVAPEDVLVAGDCQCFLILHDKLLGPSGEILQPNHIPKLHA